MILAPHIALPCSPGLPSPSSQPTCRLLFWPRYTPRLPPVPVDSAALCPAYPVGNVDNLQDDLLDTLTVGTDCVGYDGDRDYRTAVIGQFNLQFIPIPYPYMYLPDLPH